MSSDGDRPNGSRFGSTRWSIVLVAAQSSSPESRHALETLCGIYWYPVYAFVRRKGYSLHEAQDLTQDFFARVLERDVFRAADPARGRFRSFLLGCVRNFLVNEWDKRRSQKRGGGHQLLPLDYSAGDSRYLNEPASEMTPERLFDRQWAITLLDHVMDRLRDEYVESGRGDQFEQLKQFLTGRSSDSSYAEAARRLGISTGAAMSGGSRLRKRYRELLREEVAHTLDDPGEVDDELRSLFAMIGN